jgi:hypothetical protein
VPTQISVRAVRSTVPLVIDVLMLSLLAATINAIIVLIILWAWLAVHPHQFSRRLCLERRAPLMLFS